MAVTENKALRTPDELREACGDGHLIVCVGPALSTSAGLPAPAELAKQLLAVAVEHGHDVDTERLEDRLERGHVAEVLGLLRTQMGRSFEREIEVRLSDRGQAVPELAKAIAALRDELRAVYTTALDRLVERAFAGAWPSFADARADLAQRRAVIFKLRGTLEFVQSWVLTREQHERELSPRSLRQAIFEAAYNAHRIVFVGFEPDDETLARLLDAVGGTADPEQGPSHFIVLAECAPSVRAGFERRGLRVVVADGAELLRSLGGDDDDRLRQREITVSGSPYLGLEPFTENDAELFFGRQAEVSQAASRLGGLDRIHRRWLAVEGPSGVGKSSFVRAGVVPALRRGFAAGTPSRWRVATMRPGARPCHALAVALHSALELGDSVTTTTLEEELQTSRTALAQRLERHAVGSGVLLVVDQFEEIVTLASKAERASFDGALAHALEAAALYLVTTIRSDFVPALQVVLPALAGMFNEHAERYALPPISRVGLREAIAAPAMLLGVELEAPLVERLVLDADSLGADKIEEAEEGEALTRPSTLPLVAHVLRGLWDADAHDDQLIELSEYEDLGGLSGALSRSADGLLANLSDDDRKRAKALLLRMVRVEPDHADTRRAITREEAVDIAGEDVVLRLSGASVGEHLPNARLLVIEADGDQTSVELVHEALLRHWDRLIGWINENRGQLVLDAELARRAAAWESQGRPSWRVPSGKELAGLLQGRPHGKDEDRHRSFQAALQRAATLRRASWLGAAGLVAVVSLIFALVALDRKNEIIENKAKVEEQRAVALVERDNAELARRTLRRTLSAQQGMRARALIPDNAELEALTLGVRSVAAFAPSFDPPPPAEALEGLLHVLARDAVLVQPRWSGAHEERVHAVAVSPDGSMLASSSEDHTVKVWDPATGALRHSLQGHEGEVRRVVFSRDGERLLSTSYDGTARVWDPKAGGDALVEYDEHEMAVMAVSQCRDGTTVATGSTDNTVRVWRAADGTTLATLVGHDAAIVAVEFDPDCTQVISASLDGTARAWSIDTGREVRRFARHDDPIRALAMSPNGELIATAGDDRTARVFDRQTGTTLSVLAGHTGRVAHLAFSADGSRVATGSHDRTARVWDPTTGELLMTAEGHARALAGVALTSDGRDLLTASWDGDAAIWSIDSGIQHARFVAGQEGIAAMASDGSGQLFLGGWEGSVIAFQRPQPRQLTEVPGHEGFVHDIAFSPSNAAEVLTSGQDGTARIWNASTGAQRVVVEHDRGVRRAAYSPDGTQFATVSEDGTANVWATASGERVATAIEHDKPLERLSFRSRLATASSDGSALVWDPTTKTASNLRAHTEPILTLVLDPTDRFLATGSRDHTAILWDLSRGQPAFTLEGHDSDVEALAYSRDGRVLVSASRDATARVWNAADGTLTTTLVGHEGWVSVVAISADGTRVATGDSKHSVRLWDAATGAELCSLHGHTAPISAVAFSPDGARLVTGDHDSGARLWTVDNCASAAVLSGHRGIVTSAAYAADGTRIATADTHGSAKIWDATSGKLVVSIGDRIVLRQDGASLNPAVSPAQALRAGCDRLANLGAADGLADACERR